MALIFGYSHTRSALRGMRTTTLLLTFVNLWSNFQCSLGDRLAVGRMTLDHATGVRILLPQPLAYTLPVIRYLLFVIGESIIYTAVSGNP
jgi:hypothetical protein